MYNNQLGNGVAYYIIAIDDSSMYRNIKHCKDNGINIYLSCALLSLNQPPFIFIPLSLDSKYIGK